MSASKGEHEDVVVRDTAARVRVEQAIGVLAERHRMRPRGSRSLRRASRPVASA